MADDSGTLDPNQYAPNVQPTIGHPYGASIWDLLRPNPQSENAILQNIYGAGATGGAEPSAVTPPRSPLGQLLQGVGILGQPDSRPLTPFEQMQYQEGQRYRSRADLQTERMRQENLAQRFGIAEEALKGGMTQLPQSMAGMFKPDEMEQIGNEANLIGRMREQTMQEHAMQIQEQQQRIKTMQSLMDYRNWREGVDRSMQMEGKQQLIDQRTLHNPLVTPLVKQYTQIMSAVDDPNQAHMKDNNLARAAQIKQELVNRLRALHMPDDRIYQYLPEQVDPFANVGGSPQDPTNDPRMINQPNAIDQMVGQQMGQKPAQGMSRFIPPQP